MEGRVSLNRRELFGGAAAAAVISRTQSALSQPATDGGIHAEDRVFICNEDSNTLAVIDPARRKFSGAGRTRRRRPTPTRISSAAGSWSAGSHTNPRSHATAKNSG